VVLQNLYAPMHINYPGAKMALDELFPGFRFSATTIAPSRAAGVWDFIRLYADLLVNQLLTPQTLSGDV